MKPSKLELATLILIGFIIGILFVKLVEEINYTLIRNYCYEVESYGQTWTTYQVPKFADSSNGEQTGSTFVFTTIDGNKVEVSAFIIKRIK